MTSVNIDEDFPDGNVCTMKELAYKFVEEELKINENYLDKKHDMCFCKVCHRERGDQETYKRGIPPETYALPLGWFRFGLDVHNPSKDLFKNYYRAYHGTRKDSVEGILRVNHLCMPGDKLNSGKELKVLDGHFQENYGPEGFNYKRLFVSPSIVYSGYYASAVKWKNYFVQANFQVLIKPDAFAKEPQTVGAKKQIDKYFSNQEIEWATDRHFAHILYGLLIKVSASDEYNEEMKEKRKVLGR